jgi:surface antigen
MKSKFLRTTAIVTVVATFLAGCGATGQGPSNRTTGLAAGGALVGAIIGGANRGVEGAIAGALIGGAAGALVGLALDAIEAEQMRAATVAAVRSGSSQSRSFRNSSGKRVTVRVASKTVKNPSGEGQCREIRKSITREGQTSEEGSESVCQVRLANGKLDYPGV